MKNSTKTLFAVITIVVFGLAIYYQTTHKATSPLPETPLTGEKVSISTKDLQDENYSGRISVIVGDRQVAVKARDYIDEQIAEFKKTADEQVPEMRKEFGADAPMTNYMIYLDAGYLDGGKTESVVISQYAYTGGANGNSSFKVFTADSQNDKILVLSDVVREDKQADFIKLVKTELKNWKTKDAESIGLFEDAVDMLTFDSFRNWSLDSDNLTIYFDKYEIGPGVLGAMPFSVPLTKLANFLN